MTRGGVVRAAAAGVFGVLACAAFYEAAILHGGYDLPAFGLKGMPLEELAFIAWYGLWGSAGVAAFAYVAYQAFGARLEVGFACVLDSRERTVAALCFAVFCASLLFRGLYLNGQAITDDESAYELNAHLLALGEVTTAPPVHPDFLRNQFVVVDAQRFHGKYPMGHSLLLAPFALLGRVDLLGPCLAALTMALSYGVGRRFVGDRIAVLACVLLACSPHFIWTYGTLLSQTTNTACMLAAAFFHLRFSEDGRVSDGLALGSLLGFSVLVRPLPGGLVVAVLVIDGLRVALQMGGWKGVARWVRMMCPGLLLFGAALLACNYLQSGSPFSSGYAEVHGSYGAFKNESGELSNSIGVSVLRENVWLLGWPLSLVAVPFGRPRSRAGLFWSLIATSLAYRLIVPKTVVSTTGPIYLTEIVPWLCIASASGLARIRDGLARLSVAEPNRILASSLLGASVVALVCFVPVGLRAVGRASRARSELPDALAAAGAERAIVFANLMIRPELGWSWAYYPPNPWPDLRDDVLILRVPTGPDGLARARALWRERFADRPAFTFDPQRNDGRLRALDRD